jgi:hypothetical protein
MHGRKFLLDAQGQAHFSRRFLLDSIRTPAPAKKNIKWTVVLNAAQKPASNADSANRLCIAGALAKNLIGSKENTDLCVPPMMAAAAEPLLPSLGQRLSCQKNREEEEEEEAGVAVVVEADEEEVVAAAEAREGVAVKVREGAKAHRVGWKSARTA